MTYVFIVFGLLLLFAGGELLVRGAVRLASGMGISPLVVGLTVVGFGTSTPELVTSVQAAINGTPGIAIGNIVGSNIANVLLILGISALILPIAVQSIALKRDGLIMLAVAATFVVLSATTPLTRLLGGGFVLALIGYIAFVIHSERQASATAHGAVYDKSMAFETADAGVVPGQPGGLLVSLLLSIGGLALLIVGGNLLVTGATDLAREWGISETVIGLTIVAIGTSLPELITSVIAAFRKQAEVAFGNIVGSNIYNILGIGGLTALVSPLEVPEQIVAFDNPAMLAAALLLVIFAWTSYRVGRREGAVLLLGYCAYLYLVWP